MPTQLQNAYRTPENAPFTMIEVQSGAFSMGGGQHDDEKPIHTVRLNRFWIGQHPVTQALWEAVMGPGSNPSYFKGKNRPVEQVSWYDAAVFCNALNEQCGYEPCYFSDEAYQNPYGKTKEGYELPNEGPIHQKSQMERSDIPANRRACRDQTSQILPGYRLPTEAEWEYAARGGEQIRMDAARGGPNPDQRPRYAYAGGDKLDEVGWYDDNSHGETKPVGLKLPNELGIYDMSGNVWEWCEDQWHGNYEGAPEDGSAWVDQEQGPSRVSRGGSWYDHAGNCRCASRYGWLPEDRDHDLGFRLVWVSPSVHPLK